MMQSNNPVVSRHDIEKINKLYIEILNINRAMLKDSGTSFSVIAGGSSYEAKLFFGNLDSTLIELFDRIRNFKLDILSNIPKMDPGLFANKKKIEKIANAIYEYVFSGFAICMIEEIIHRKRDFTAGHLFIAAEPVWDIFTARLSGFRVPQMHEFFNNPQNAEIAAIFNLMFDSMYESLKKDVPELGELKENLNLFVKEVIEKSIIEGMLLYRSYEEALFSSRR